MNAIESCFCRKTNMIRNSILIKLLNLSNVIKTTVRLWFNRWKETKDHSDRPRTERSRITTAEDDELIVDLAKQDVGQGITTKQIQEELEDRVVNTSRRTVENCLFEAGFNYSKPFSKSLLSPQYQRNRLNWAKSMKNYDWNKIIVSDETTVRLNAGKNIFGKDLVDARLFAQ